MADAEPRMWSYWRDKYGAIGALEEYYPETLAENPSLVAMHLQVKMGLRMIDEIMSKAEEEDRNRD